MYAGNIPSKFCDYERLLSNTTDDNLKAERTELYKKLLGILSDLANYRSEYIVKGEPVNLFPTVYFHMTAIEMDKIRQGQFRYPEEKNETDALLL